MRAAERTESSVEVELLDGLVALGAERARAGAELLDERAARVVVDQLVHHREALEGVLAVEDARLVSSSDSLPPGYSARKLNARLIAAPPISTG